MSRKVGVQITKNEKLLEYEACEKAIQNHNQFLFEANSNRIDDLKRAATDKLF